VTIRRENSRGLATTIDQREYWDRGPDDVTGLEWTEIAAVVAARRRTEQEQLASGQAPTPAPRRERPGETISGADQHRSAAVDPNALPDAANNIAGRRGHRLQEQEGSGQVTTRVSEHAERQWQMDDRKIAVLGRIGG
jgi:hypothetical protein